MLQGFLEDHNCGFDTGILFSKLMLLQLRSSAIR